MIFRRGEPSVADAPGSHRRVSGLTVLAILDRAAA
jgi:hypothetical protein